MHESGAGQNGSGNRQGSAPMSVRGDGVTVRQGQWRSLEELADSPEFQRWLDDEFPHRASLLSMDRRHFLQVAGASLALAGLTGCRFLPNRRAVPYVRPPEEQVPGVPLDYASAIVLSGIASGVLVRSYEGRPIKIEGNPTHPASLGASDALTQAALLDMYDPDRSRNVLQRGGIASWPEFEAALAAVLAAQRAKSGAGLRIVSGAITSPSLEDQVGRLMQQYPDARWYQYEAVHRDEVRGGTEAAFGRPLNPVYRFDEADVVVSLDGDFLNTMPGHVRYARDFMNRRRVRGGRISPNRLYVAESMPTGTGAVADHRLPMRLSEMGLIALELARLVGMPGTGAGHTFAGYAQQWLQACAADLKAHRGRCVVVVGDRVPREVHVLAAALNEFLGASGHAVQYIEPVYWQWDEWAGVLRKLATEINAGRVEALIVLGANPVYDAPADVALGDLMRRVPFTAHAGLHADETAAVCQWHVPLAHDLESWGDARSYDGTVTLQQPLIEPLFAGRTVAELVSLLAGRPAQGYELLRGYWTRRLAGSDAAQAFRRAIHDGFIADSALPAVDARVRPVAVEDAVKAIAASERRTGDGLELAFAQDPSVYDGRFANNGWLQELPKEITRLTWDNAAFVAPATARELGIESGDVVSISADGRTLQLPVRVQPGHAPNAITLHLGGGRWQAGSVGNRIGVNANELRSSSKPWLLPAVEISRTGMRYTFTLTEDHHAIQSGRIAGQQGRDIVRVVTAEELGKTTKSSSAEGHGQTAQGFYDGKDHAYDGYAWGMVVDLTLCTGCNACVVACQAENNIPVVGRDQVARGREMHWIRIDRYYEGDANRPAIHHQPVMCMHCEQAPCEPVCPVAATVHSHEGLNQMVYNRCVGTRYCSNNCPYKVRRFNFLNYANHDEPRILQMLRNPNVTVRGRGVMEKCTFCVQRINVARIAAKKENRAIWDGEIQTACQQACPTKAIVFGNIADAASEVSRLKKEPRNYSLLEELNTRPRLTYLARTVNPASSLGGRERNTNGERRGGEG